MKNKHKIILTLAISACVASVYVGMKKINPNPKFTIGQKIDSLNGVFVFYNGGVSNVEERNLGPDGYNLGLKYQCVEFVKRYYYEYYHHKMPDTYGNAKDFFDANVGDGEINKKRKLLQYANPATVLPKEGDLLIFDGHAGNSYGHVAIVSRVDVNHIEMIQQNPGPFAPSRQLLDYSFNDGLYKIQHDRLLGWLRKKISE